MTETIMAIILLIYGLGTGSGQALIAAGLFGIAANMNLYITRSGVCRDE